MAIGFAILAAALFGLLSVGMRTGLRRQPDVAAGAAAAGLIGLVVSAVVPGLSTILLARAVRDAGPSRASIVIGTAPVISALLVAFDRGKVVVVAPLNATRSLFAVVLAAIVFRRAEMIGPRLVLAGLLVVAGSSLIGLVR